MAHPDLPSEQAYLDRAYAELERMRDTIAQVGNAADNEVAALALDAWARRRLATFDDAERELCFGRLDLDGIAKPLYVGRRWVHDEAQEVLVCNWQAPAARPFYTATPANPERVTLRRRFRSRGRELLEISDETLDGSGDSVAGGDFLLEELERSRESHMRDIVATIQADQYRLITREPRPPLVIQGGPGTGKTAVGLHRASWLLYTHREQLARSGVLVVGPNPTFMEYVSHVLPALGEDAVEQRAVGELVDGIVPARADPPEVARLKADTRLTEVVARAAELRSEPAPEELYARLEGAFVKVREREVRELVERIRAEHGLTAQARERFRMAVLRRFYEDYNRVHEDLAVRDFGEIERALKAKGFLVKWLDRVWPTVAPQALVRDLLTSRERLAAATDGILDADEQRLLLRPRRGFAWSEGDVPLLDEAAALLAAAPRTFGHVIVDEAQDLTPMQLRMVARRAQAGSLTLLGDIAQATGPVAYGSWLDVTQHLDGDEPAAVEELRHAYRVPREIMELALPLLAAIAPDLEPPLAFREGAAPPRLLRVEETELAERAIGAAAALGDGLAAVILPETLLPQLEAGSAFEEGIQLLTARRAKGLEFDHVVVVEPAAIAGEEQGLRGLYVALTRPTRSLTVVHARPLPAPLGSAG